jgi:hypothetical protein
MAAVTEALPARPLAGTDEALLVAQIDGNMTNDLRTTRPELGQTSRPVPFRSHLR